MPEEVVPKTVAAPVPTSMSLIEEAVAGDPRAWERIVYLYAPLIDLWCRWERLGEHAIADVGQDVLATLLGKLNTFKKDEPRHSFRGWLYSITYRKICDYWKQNPTFVHIDSIPEPRTPSSRASGSNPPSERLVLLRRCVEAVRSEFEPRTFEAFLQVVMEGKPTGEVARALGMPSVGAVYTARSRVTKRLRAMLAEFGEDLP